MSYRILGAILIITGCGGYGFSLVRAEMRQEALLKRLLAALQFMRQELSFRMTPLPELLILAGKQAGGELQAFLTAVSRSLSAQVLPDVSSCMKNTLQEFRDFPRPFRCLLRMFGNSLGYFDLPGQLEGLKEVEESCKRALKLLEEGRGQRYRSYETLGICAGLALAILFI